MPVAGIVVYRAVRQVPIGPTEFLSVAELNLKGSDAAKCKHWGLSVWLSDAAVEHARSIFFWLRKLSIARGMLNADDGVIIATPSNDQPEHHTFWKDCDRDISQQFNVVLEPLTAPAA